MQCTLYGSKGSRKLSPEALPHQLCLYFYLHPSVLFLFSDGFDDFRRCGEHVRKPEPKLLCDAASAYRNDGTVNFQAVKVFFTLVLVDVAVIVFIAVFRYILGYHDSFFDGLKIWRMLDSQHYLYIAEHWYTAEGNYGDIVKIVFLPGYPVLVAAVRFIVRDYLAAGLIVSGICFAGAGALLYLLMRLDCGHDEAIRAVKFMCLIPGAFFFTAPMSESLFLLTTLARYTFARRRKFFVSACFWLLCGFYPVAGHALYNSGDI